MDGVVHPSSTSYEMVIPKFQIKAQVSVSILLRNAARLVEPLVSTKHDVPDVTSEMRWQAGLGSLFLSLFPSGTN